MNFWKTYGATMAAFATISVIGFVILIIMGIKFLSMLNLEIPQQVVKPQTVLCIDLAENIVDAPRVSTFGEFDATTMTFSEPLTLVHAISAIEHAATDSNIKGICIKIDGMGSANVANIEELRAAIKRFKASGKFVVAYDDNYTQSDYYLASVADHVILQPEGSLEWRGVSFTSIYLKGLLDKIDAKVEVFRPDDCKYKSAVETFTRSSMSQEDREQMEAVANTIWDGIVEDVALSRNLDAEHIKQLAADLDVSLANEALDAGLIDEIGYEDALYDYFKKRGIATNAMNGFNMVTLGEYSSIIHADWSRIPFKAGSDVHVTPNENLVAVLYADGEIVDGNMFMDDYVYGTMLAAQLRQLRLDGNTKAVVLRVNSPGGSALASDVVWREMVLLQKKKPLVVSMGGSAASGGYYISVPADFIYADRSTLTGSIGVFGVMFNLQTTLQKHLGVTFDAAGTSPEASGISLAAPISKRQREQINKGVNQTYNTFTSHVAEGRNMSLDSVLEVAEGRVWSGAQALELGLVDGIGGITEAIALSAELADLGNNFTIYEMCPPPTPLEELIDSISSLFFAPSAMAMPSYKEAVNKLIKDNLFIFNYRGIQCIMPNKVEINL